MTKVGTSPERDASLGLIFRMNALWEKVDGPAEAGDYDEWNNVLDRIYANLDYKDDYRIEYEEDGKTIKEVILNEKDPDDEKIYNFFCVKVANAKKIFLHSSKNKDKAMARGRWYKILMKKDIWLRKLMFKRGLYLKEVEHTPGSALFGTFGKKK
ncbi:MAG: hypothetical protein ACP5D2_02110 [Candidatus Nanoarchaeia archaeon]